MWESKEKVNIPRKVPVSMTNKARNVKEFLRFNWNTKETYQSWWTNPVWSLHELQALYYLLL